nr:hypothetical protein [Tanacetum cinerariifolium]
ISCSFEAASLPSELESTSLRFLCCRSPSNRFTLDKEEEKEVWESLGDGSLIGMGSLSRDGSLTGVAYAAVEGPEVEEEECVRGTLGGGGGGGMTCAAAAPAATATAPSPPAGTTNMGAKRGICEKGKGWEAYAQILDFLNRSHIQYALTHRPYIVFDSLVKQFWATVTVHNHEAGPSKIISTIDGNEVVVTESLIRTQLQLNDVDGLYEFTLYDVLDGMREIGYPTDGSLTFYKAKLSPQWRFLIHTLIHCMSPKSGGWNQFPSFIASALI